MTFRQITLPLQDYKLQISWKNKDIFKREQGIKPMQLYTSKLAKTNSKQFVLAVVTQMDHLASKFAIIPQ